MTASGRSAAPRGETERAWDVDPRAPAPAANGWFAQFWHDLATYRAWWIVSAALTLALAAGVLLLARGDVHVPAIYRLF